MKIKKITVLALTLWVGAFLLCSNSKIPTVAKNTQINGISVGGMSYEAAKRKVREKMAENAPVITVKDVYGECVLSYPQIDFKDSLSELLPLLKEGESAFAEAEYYIKDINGVANNLCSQCENALKEPSFEFDGSFSYYGGEIGIYCDRGKLVNGLESALQRGGGRVEVDYTQSYPKGKVEDITERTRLICSFTTYYDGENKNRSSNIALSASSINGYILKSEDEFSFNKTVGKRSVDRGYKRAKIIENGKFVYGIGGGVCQVSTTLYNCALLCGLEITAVKAHTLPVSYIEPSFDAMVSSYSDLKFKNIKEYPVYIACETSFNSVTVKMYSKDDGVRYERVSKVIPFEEAEFEEVSEKNIYSVGELKRVIGGKTVEERLIRKDEYKLEQKSEKNGDKTGGQS